MKPALIILFFISTICNGQSPWQDAFKKDVYIQASDSLPYRLAYPFQYDQKKKYPLLIFLHGSGQRGNDNERQLGNVSLFIDSLHQTNYACFILVPQCPKNDVWVKFPFFPKSLAATDTPTTTARLCLSLIDDLQKKMPIDQNRIYITGASMGGEGVFDFLTRRPELFAAAIPVCSVSDTSKAFLIKHIPVCAFHGDADKVNDVLYSRIMIDALKKAGGHPVYTEYEGVAHSSWLKAYKEPDLLRWLFNQSKKNK